MRNLKAERQKAASEGRCYVCRSRTRLPASGKKHCDYCYNKKVDSRRRKKGFVPANLRWLEDL